MRDHHNVLLIMPEPYAIIQNSLVINTVVWDGGPEWQPPQDCIAVPIGSSGAGIGWSYVNGQFIPPPPEPDQA